MSASFSVLFFPWHYYSHFSAALLGSRPGGPFYTFLRISTEYIMLSSHFLSGFPSFVSPPSLRGQRPRSSTPLTPTLPTRVAEVERLTRSRQFAKHRCKAEGLEVLKGVVVSRHSPRPRRLVHLVASISENGRLGHMWQRGEGGAKVTCDLKSPVKSGIKYKDGQNLLRPVILSAVATKCSKQHA